MGGFFGTLAGQGLSAAGSGILSARLGRREKQRAYNKDVKFWRMMADYNAPVNQVQRLREAGLAPQLMYGQGASASTGNMSQLTKYNPQEYNVNAIDVANIKLAGAQTDLAKSQASVNKEVAVIKAIEKDFEYWKKFGIKVADFEYDEDGNPLGPEARQIINTANLTGAQRSKFLAETDNLTKEAPWYRLKGNLAKQGLNINDPVLMRILYKTLKDNGWIDDRGMIIAVLGALTAR